jgi:phosphoglycolate phosphatase
MMDSLMALKLIVFDLDGTLADTARDLTDSVNELRRRRGLPRLTVSQVSRHVGQGVRHLLDRTVPALAPGARKRHPDLYAEFQRIYVRRCTHHTRLFPGARAVLRRLGRDAILAVATNKPGGLSRRILRRLGVLGKFSTVVGGDEMRARKPHPAVLLDLMRRFKAGPAETVFVGDSRFDMETARRARVRAVACTFGFGSRAELLRWRPAATISRLAALPAALARLSR